MRSSASAAAGWEGTNEARSAVSGGSIAADKPEVITKLLAAAKTSTLTDDKAAMTLLDAGPGGTAEAFRWLNAAKTDHAALPPLQRSRLEPVLKRAPAAILGIAQRPQYTTAAQNHAFTTGLEVIVGLGGESSAQDLTTWLQAASASAIGPALRPKITKAVARLATQPEIGSPEVSSWINAAGANLSTSVVDGVSQAKAVMSLIGSLHSSTGAEGAILNRTTGLIQGGEPVETGVAILAVLPFLSSQNAFERAESSSIIGLVGDRRHVKDLITGLDDGERMVRTNALKALKKLTGMTISGDASRWNQWHSEQEIWWDEKGADLVDSLRSARRNELVRLLKQVSTRRLYRKEITAQLLPMLQRAEWDEVRVAVASLATLRNPAALPAILELRGHVDPGVRSSVEDALIAFRHSGIRASRVKVLPRQ